MDAVYFLTVTITTIGYGDMHPNTDRERLITIFVIIFGIAFVFSSLNNAISIFLKRAEAMLLDLHEEGGSEDFDIEKEDKAMRNRHRRRVLYSVGSATIVVLVGTWVLAKMEGWTAIEALYFSVVTTTTVGYGDICVSTNGRLFLTFYILVSVVVVAATITNLATINIETEAQQRRLDAMSRPLKEDMIREMDKNADGKVSKWEFLSAMLVATTDLDYDKDVKPWVERFNQLDHTGDGQLNQEDIDALIAAQRQKAKERAERAEKLKKLNRSVSRRPSRPSTPDPKSSSRVNRSSNPAPTPKVTELSPLNNL